MTKWHVWKMDPIVFVAQINAQAVIPFVIFFVFGYAVAFVVHRRWTAQSHTSSTDDATPHGAETVPPETPGAVQRNEDGPNVFGQTDYPEFRQHLREVLDQISQGVIIWAEGGQEIYRNAQARRFLEARDSLVLVEIALQDLRERDLSEPGHDGPIQEEVELIGPPVQVYVISMYPFSEDGGGQGALVLIEDASAQRRIDTVRRDFVANISHELKTPIGALGLLSETILDEDDDEVIRRLVQRLVEEADRASRTVDDLLELSQIEFGDETEFEEVSVHHIVAEATNRLGGAVEHSNVNIEVDIEDGLYVIGNRPQLVSAMYNLIDNSLKYSPAGSTVKVSGVCVTSTSADRTPRAEITISDTGIGIPRRDQDRIFERFYRVDRARARSSGGTGLGLAIVRHIVSNHGGSIDVSSIEGVGSTFTITLKCPQNHDAIQPQHAVESSTQNPPKEMTR